MKSAKKRVGRITATCVAILFGIVGGLMPLQAALAATPSSANNVNPSETANLLDNVLGTFKQDSYRWVSTFQRVADHLFYYFALIAFVWMAIEMLWNNQTDWSRFFHEIMKYAVVTGLYLWFLEKGPLIATAIVDGFAKLGHLATGMNYSNANSYGAAGLLDAAGDLWLVVINIGHSVSVLSDGFLEVLLALIIGITGSIICALMAFQIMVAWVVAYGAMYGGIFFLAFGGGPWLRDIVMSYWKTVIAKGTWLMALLLVSSLFLNVSNGILAKILAEQAAATANVSNHWYSIYGMSVQEVVVDGKIMKYMLYYLVEAVLCWEVMKLLPNILSQIPFGGHANAGQNVSGGAMAAAVGAAGGVAAMVATGGAGGAALAASGSGGAGGSFGGGSSGGGSSGGGSSGGGSSGGASPMISDSAIAGDSSGSSGESGAGAGVGGGAGAPSGGGTMGDATMTQGASGAGSGGVDKRAELSRINRRLAARAAAHVLLAPVHLMAASEGRGGQLMTGFRQDMEARRRIKSQMP